MSSNSTPISREIIFTHFTGGLISKLYRVGLFDMVNVFFNHFFQITKKTLNQLIDVMLLNRQFDNKWDGYEILAWIYVNCIQSWAIIKTSFIFCLFIWNILTRAWKWQSFQLIARHINRNHQQVNLALWSLLFQFSLAHKSWASA